MRSRIILAALVALLGVWPAQAQSRGGGGRGSNGDDDKLKVGDYAPDFEAKDWINVDSKDDVPSLAELRGLVVAVFFWPANHEGGEVVLPYVTMYEHSRIGTTQGVYVVGLTNGTRQVAQRIAQKAMAFFPIGVESEVAKDYGVEGGFGFVVIDAEGRLAYRGSGTDLDGLGNAIAEALRKTPPSRTHPDQAKKVHKLLDLARERIRNNKFRRAFEAARDAFERAVSGDPLRSEVMDVIDLLEALGYDRIDRAIPLVEQGKYSQAVNLLRSVEREFAPPLDAGKDARELYQAYEKEFDGFRDAVQAHKAEDEAADLLLDARADVRAQRFGDSYEKLQRILTDYADTKAAQYARGMLDRMKANADVWAIVMDEQAKSQCEVWLAEVRNHIRQHRYDKARELLRRIRNDYPGTVYDKRAKDMLVNLPR